MMAASVWNPGPSAVSVSEGREPEGYNALGNGSRALGCTGVTRREPWQGRVVVAKITIGRKFEAVDELV